MVGATRLDTTLIGEALGHADALHELARYLTGRDADAEDLVQETYARALGAGARFTPGTNLKAWLFRILRNAFLDAARRRRRAPPRAGADLDEAPGPEPAILGDAELGRLRGVVAEEIEGALRTLPEEARTVILLDVEGLDEGEIAEVMGCARGTVKSRLHRARSALRARLSEYRR